MPLINNMMQKEACASRKQVDIREGMSQKDNNRGQTTVFMQLTEKTVVCPLLFFLAICSFHL